MSLRELNVLQAVITIVLVASPTLLALVEECGTPSLLNASALPTPSGMELCVTFVDMVRSMEVIVAVTVLMALSMMA